jgi:hypothetical protein
VIPSGAEAPFYLAPGRGATPIAPTLASAVTPCYDPGMPPPAPPRLARLALAATLVHLVFDTAGRAFTVTTPPYLLLPYMSELFRDMLGLLGVNAISAVTCAINGLIGGVFATALFEVERRRRALGLLLTGIWLLTCGAMFSLYLSAPWAIAIGSMAFGLPRAAALAWVLERMMAGATADRPAARASERPIAFDRDPPAP